MACLLPGPILLLFFIVACSPESSIWHLHKHQFFSIAELVLSHFCAQASGALSPKPGLLKSNYLHFLACLLLWRIDKAMIVVSIL